VIERRARPLLGTLVEISLAGGPTVANAALFELGFAAVLAAQQRWSRFEPTSEIGRFNALAAGQSFALKQGSARLLWMAAWLQARSDGQFDISQGTGRWGLADGSLHKLGDHTRLDLGGIAKGWAVDRAIAALKRAGARWACVNAGGDLRVFGAQPVALHLRDEQGGGVRAFGQLADGSFATSQLGRHHVSVAAPRAVWADALTKVVAASGDTAHPLLARVGATAWIHETTPPSPLAKALAL
jgi:thiamine biosynthesis lipoprotein